jgi:elongation factor P--(R)-beta-lysine ligase
MSYDLSPSDFRPTAPWENLRRRAEMLRRLREFFRRHDMLEVETPVLSADTVVDRHLDPFCVEAPTLSRPFWLQTSPEFGMKRLLAAGGPSMYQITRAFRQEELGPLHNPEFTMVEWYRLSDDMPAGIQFLSDLCEEMLACGPAERLSYAEAFRRFVGLDPHAADCRELIAAARDSAIVAPETMAADDRDGWLDLLLAERVQPHLGVGRPAIVYDFPASQAALAQVRGESPPLAERFELYADGLELANGYHELSEPRELRRRAAEANRQRMADGKRPLPEDNRMLAAMEAGLPPVTGVALGFDRLVMIACGAKTLGEVVAFPFDRA